MEVECEIGRSKDDEIELIYSLLRENVEKFTDRELRQHSDTLVNDIMQFNFDFLSDVNKYKRYGQEFLKIIKLRSDDAIKHVDLYWIHEQLSPIVSSEKHSYNLIIETSTNSADGDCIESETDAGFLENIISHEFQAARYLLSNLHLIDGMMIHRVLIESKYRNVRRFIDAGFKHEKCDLEKDFYNITSFFKETNNTLSFHRCIEENAVFLMDFLLDKVLPDFNETMLRNFLTQKDSNNNTIFQLACSKRLKFLIEEIWSLTKKAFESLPNGIEEFLLNKNKNGKNLFQIAFEMPLIYDKSDYANEIKNRNSLLNYYRDPGPLEIEIYNFESCLNLIFDIARKNISDTNKRKLIVENGSKAVVSCNRYSYDKEFADFRCDFLQLRFYCITKISLMKTDKIDSVIRVYNFLSYYVDDYMLSYCSKEDEMMKLYQKLSLDQYLRDFFKIFLHSNFLKTLLNITTPEYVRELIEMTKRTLSQKEYHQILNQNSFNGNNALQLAITSENAEIFKIIWLSFEYDQKAVIKWILSRNNDRMNSLHLALYTRQIEVLQTMLEFFSMHLNENEIMRIFENSLRGNHKLLDFAIRFYDQVIFSLFVNFIQNYLSAENQKKMFSSQIISFAVSKWQESALVEILKLIEIIFDENEIKELLFSANWEGQTAFHVASKNTNMFQLQTLCKFARYYLTEDDFVKIVTSKDMNDYSIVNDSATQQDVYENLPNLSNFLTNYSIFVWIPFDNDNFNIPNDAFKIGEDEKGENIYLARLYDSNDENTFEMFGLTKTYQGSSDQLIDILRAHGIEWTSKNKQNIKPLRIENAGKSYYIGRIKNEVKFVSKHSDETISDLLCINDQIFYETNQNNFIFRRTS